MNVAHTLRSSSAKMVTADQFKNDQRMLVLQISLYTFPLNCSLILGGSRGGGGGGGASLFSKTRTGM